MAVACPAFQWPQVLEERGPAIDPSIFLTGASRIGATAVQIVAIRIDPRSGTAPDYRSDLADPDYQLDGLDAILETVVEDFDCLAADLADALGESGLNLVELATGSYMIWVVPASFGP